MFILVMPPGSDFEDINLTSTPDYFRTLCLYVNQPPIIISSHTQARSACPGPFDLAERIV